jgi:hypothetical protein
VIGQWGFVVLGPVFDLGPAASFGGAADINLGKGAKGL